MYIRKTIGIKYNPGIFPTTWCFLRRIDFILLKKKKKATQKLSLFVEGMHRKGDAILIFHGFFFLAMERSTSMGRRHSHALLRYWWCESVPVINIKNIVYIKNINIYVIYRLCDFIWYSGDRYFVKWNLGYTCNYRYWENITIEMELNVGCCWAGVTKVRIKFVCTTIIEYIDNPSSLFGSGLPLNFYGRWMGEWQCDVSVIEWCKWNMDVKRDLRKPLYPQVKNPRISIFYFIVHLFRIRTILDEGMGQMCLIT